MILKIAMRLRCTSLYSPFTNPEQWSDEKQDLLNLSRMEHELFWLRQETRNSVIHNGSCILDDYKSCDSAKNIEQS